ncbi:MAG: DUF3298 domain-containing protein [Clostridia bacterium]|nr:DUF3298 domain-containing protein [Clostridia bacterium]
MKYPFNSPRVLSISLAAVLLFGILGGCGSEEPAETTVVTPAVTVATTTYDATATLAPVTVGVSPVTSTEDATEVTTPSTDVSTLDTEETSDTTAVSTPPETSETSEPVTEPQMTLFQENESAVLNGSEEIDGTVVLRYTISYPTFTSNNGSSADAINTAVAAAAAEFETYAKEVLFTFAEQAHKFGDDMLPYSFSVDYEVVISSGTAVSVVFTKTELAGETREAYSRSACVFSPITNTVVTLSDVFSGGSSAYTQTIYSAVFAKIATNADAFYADYENLAQFFPISDRWYLGENGVVIFFNPYEIAGYDQGIVEFTLPYNDYSDQLKLNPLYMG